MSIFVNKTKTAFFERKQNMIFGTILIIILALFGIVLVAGSAGSMGRKSEKSGWGAIGGEIACFLFGLVLIAGSYLIFFDTYGGYWAVPFDLNEKIIYRVEGQIKTSNGKNTVVVRNAIGKGCPRWVENPEPLDPNVRLVKVVKGEKGGYELVPLEEKTTAGVKEANEPDK